MRIFIRILVTFASLAAQAGGIFYNSNQSAEYIRSFDRNSAIDNADIAYYNIAGTVRLGPGFTFNISNQTILQWASVAPLDNPVLGGRTYHSSNPVWLVPNAYGVYRRRDWALFGGLETLGATAVRHWPDGLPSMDLAGKRDAGYGGKASQDVGQDAMAAVLAAGGTQAQAQAAYAQAALDAAPFPSHSWLKGSSAFLAWRLGAARRISEAWSLALAGRLVYARQDAVGGWAGACTYDQYGDDLRTATSTRVEVSSRALGWSAELGCDWFPAAGVVLSLTWEMATALPFRTTLQDGADGGGSFRGGTARLDLPEAWRFGAGWQAAPDWRLSTGLNLYREGRARLDLLRDPAAGSDPGRDYGTTWEMSLAVERRWRRRWLFSLGGNFNRIGQRPDAARDVGLAGAHADYLSLGTGCQYQPTPRLKLNFGLAMTGFVHPRRTAADPGDRLLQAAFAAAGQAVQPSREFDKRYLVLALGLDCRIPAGGRP